MVTDACLTPVKYCSNRIKLIAVICNLNILRKVCRSTAFNAHVFRCNGKGIVFMDMITRFQNEVNSLTLDLLRRPYFDSLSADIFNFSIKYEEQEQKYLMTNYSFHSEVIQEVKCNLQNYCDK
jgi:hypothetical protein